MQVQLGESLARCIFLKKVLPFLISKKTPVNRDRTVFLKWVRGRDFHFQVEWPSLSRSAHGRSKENISKWDKLKVFFNDLSFCALVRLYETILRRQWNHLNFSALTVEFKSLIVDCPWWTWWEIKYPTLCFIKYCICFSKFVDWGMGEDKRITFNLCILPSHIELCYY